MVLEVSNARQVQAEGGAYKGIYSRPLCPFFIRIMMSRSKANCGHCVINLGVPRSRESAGPSSARYSDRREGRNSNTHDDVVVDGRLVILAVLVNLGELPPPLELYSSESEDESVCEESASELEDE